MINLDDEKLMLIKVKKVGHFYRLMDDPEYAEEFFSNFDYKKMNVKTLHSLEVNVKKTERKKDNYKKVGSWLRLNGFRRMANDFYFRTSAVDSDWLRARDELNMFESNLVYLIINSKFTLDDVSKAGFRDEYILKLLEKYKSRAEKNYIQYYYNTETGRTYVTSDNDLVYQCVTTPEEVLDEVAKEYAKKKK